MRKEGCPVSAKMLELKAQAFGTCAEATGPNHS
ncbi:hypothetical protein L914_13769 [Phytophthora nicotianae]|uniref:Uncharacterized protein n=2 Tax=Phytophthora nicotianae TaxID=4792 RepID=W2MV78_PHYNI|nr:hypothetical protein L914_13769 [Phytophthora nicotianae]ETO58975.1 hypothetical protein F444_22647 [Phytophthora nicotianae P1976]